GLEGARGILLQKLSGILGVSIRPNHATFRAEVRGRAEVKGPGRPQCEDEACYDLIGLKAITFRAFHIASENFGASAKRAFFESHHTQTIPATTAFEQQMRCPSFAGRAVPLPKIKTKIQTHMSHFTEIKTQIKDIEALRLAEA